MPKSMSEWTEVELNELVAARVSALMYKPEEVVRTTDVYDYVRGEVDTYIATHGDLYQDKDLLCTVIDAAFEEGRSLP